MRRRDRSAAFLVAAAIWVGLFALGSVPRWAACLTAALGLAAALPYLSSRRGLTLGETSAGGQAHRRPGAAHEIPPVLVLAALAAGFTALQLLPLPAGLVAWLSPARHALAADNAATLGTALPRLLPLSYDPPATLVELAKLLACLGVAFACTRVAASARGRTWLAGTCAAAGAALAATALVHRALGLDALFGLYHPRDFRPVYLAPLLNPNHLAGYLAMAAPLALGLAAAAGRGPRLLWIGAATLCAATNLLLASRGGAIALGVGLLLAAGLLLARRQDAPPLPWSVRIPTGIVAACALLLLASFTAGDIRDELAATTAAELRDPGSKVGIWRGAVDLLDRHRWTGVGRGAFEPAFTAFDHGGIKTYSHVENEYLQAAADWGLPAAAALLLALGWTLRHALRRWRAGPIEAGALAAVAAIGLHNGVDFNLQLPGVALSAIAVLAILLPARVHTLPAPRRRRRVALRAALVAIAAAVIAAAASPLGRDARTEADALAALLADAAAHRAARAPGGQVGGQVGGKAGGQAGGQVGAEAGGRVGDQSGAEAGGQVGDQSGAEAGGQVGDQSGAEAGDSPADSLIRQGHRLIARHPADYLIMGLTAQAYLRARDPRAVRLANRALALNPEHPGLHMLAARMLLAAGRRDQALLEYRLALRHTLTPRDILLDLLRSFPDAGDAARGIPALPDRVAVMANRLVTLGRPDVALAYARLVHERYPDDFEAQRTLAPLALRHGERGDSDGRDDSDGRGAADHVALALAAAWPAYRHSGHAREALVLARALGAAGRLDEARAVLEETIARRGHDRLDQRVRLHAALARVHGERGDHQAARDSMRAALSLAQDRLDRRTRADLHRGMAIIQERLGNSRQAAEERKRADALAPMQ